MSTDPASSLGKDRFYATIHKFPPNRVAKGGGDGYDFDMDARIDAIEKKVDGISVDFKSFKRWCIGIAIGVLAVFAAIVGGYTAFVIYEFDKNNQLSMDLLEKFGDHRVDIEIIKKDIEELKQRNLKK